MDFSTTIGLLGVIFAFYRLLLIVYRLSFHPLSKFPGPKVAAATRLYEGYHDVVRGGKYIFQIGELHKQYGPIVRISPDELHVNDPSFHTTLYSHTGRWNKYAFAFQPFQRPYSAFGTIDHDLHRRRRAPLSPLYTKDKIHEKESLLREQVLRLKGRIEQSVASGEVLNIGMAFAALSMDISTSYFTGQSMGNLDRSDFNTDLAKFFTDFGPLWILGKHLPLLPWAFRRLPTWTLSYLGKRLKAYKGLSERNLATVRRVLSEKEDSPKQAQSQATVVHEILGAKEFPDKSSKELELFEEVDTIVSAGTEMGRIMRVLTYHLYSNPSILLRLRKELDQAQLTNTAALESLYHLEKLPFLTAVITEGLRLTYGTVTRLQRIAPDRVVHYGDWAIPPGTPIGMSNGLLFHDERFFPDSNSFVPERWLDPENKRRMETVFAPFGRGPRTCLGINLVWAKLYLTVPAVFSNFDMELYQTKLEDVEFGSDAYVTQTKGSNGVRVTVKHRANHHLAN
ncbi:MAG: hypothetical protein Q9168_004660 [Polycauliona sp. 1 TL-2023]